MTWKQIGRTCGGSRIIGRCGRGRRPTWIVGVVAVLTGLTLVGQPLPAFAALEAQEGYAEYTVQSGDYLASIAQAHSMDAWDLIELNGDRYPTLWSNPDSIQPGWVLVVSAGAAPSGNPAGGADEVPPEAPAEAPTEVPAEAPPAAATPEPPPTPPPAPPPVPATGSGQFMGFYDCTSVGDGSPHVGMGCDSEFHDAMGSLGGRGWVTVTGYVGGSFLEGYAVNGDVLDFNQIPPGVNILLRLDSGGGRTFPPVRDDSEYDLYGQAVVDWLNMAPGSDRVQYVQLGNEQDQYVFAYPDWDSGWNPPGMSDEDMGVALCNHMFGIEKRVQFMTPERYAKLFVAVAAKLRENGKPQSLVTVPPIPRNFGQWGSIVYPNEVCRDYSIGDYLQAIDQEASRRGVANPVGGIGIHLQGVPYDLSYDNTYDLTLEDITGHVNDTHTLTISMSTHGGFLTRAKGRYGGHSTALFFVSETHPPPPFWQNDYGVIMQWTYDTARAVHQFNRGGYSSHKVYALTFYRWQDGSDVPIGGSRAAVLDGIRQAIIDFGL
jgi:hypothetical protein